MHVKNIPLASLLPRLSGANLLVYSETKCMKCKPVRSDRQMELNSMIFKLLIIMKNVANVRKEIYIL
jgi:hypothetical protein